MQNVHRVREPYRVDRSLSIAAMIGYNLKNTGPKAFQRLCIHVLASHLGLVKRESDVVANGLREFEQAAARVRDEDERHLGWIMPNMA
jgi:hypothetical protein